MFTCWKSDDCITQMKCNSGHQGWPKNTRKSNLKWKVFFNNGYTSLYISKTLSCLQYFRIIKDRFLTQSIGNNCIIAVINVRTTVKSNSVQTTTPAESPLKSFMPFRDHSKHVIGERWRPETEYDFSFCNQNIHCTDSTDGMPVIVIPVITKVTTLNHQRAIFTIHINVNQMVTWFTKQDIINK